MRLLIFFFLFSICQQGSSTTYRCNASASCGCSGSSTVLTRIVGGEAAVQGSWSWAVSLRQYGSHICGGSILSPLFIITAAHCINDVTDTSSITILVGSVTLVPSESNKFYQYRSIAQIYKHSSYDSNYQTNDIALLRLSNPLDMTNGNLEPICLPTGSTVQPPDNSKTIAVGWGVTAASSTAVSSILRQVTVQSIPSTADSCQSVVYNSRLQFCAGLESGGKDTCQGDSGGPLMSFVNGLWQLHGLTSYGYGCALPGQPGVYTRVSSYVTWIKSITRQYETVIITMTKPTTIRTTKKQVIITSTKRRELLTTITGMTSNETDHSTKENNLAGPLLRGSTGVKHSTTQSLFLMFFVPLITGVYSCLSLL